ncbi:MAG TPA: LuxR C-terminal-related transcriptional regulator [Pseudonocardiaceae bacterium]|nr:LuxR C-terminal-related transcriptional regulator [Pseudonocardiaceae bacterium]
MRSCPVCGRTIAARQKGSGGRPAKYCSSACRQRAFRQRSAAPAVAGTESHGDDLPPALDCFVGRQREIRKLRSLLRSARLLSLVGPAGVGKTRLAMELVRRGRVPDIHLVELESLHDGTSVSPAMAESAGVTDSGASVRDALVNAIGDRKVLVILDNCEHLVRSCASHVERLLADCPGVRVLATSQVPLGVAGEVVFRVEVLPLPDEHADHDRTAVLRSPAARLFVERAHASEPAFELTADNAGVVADICRRLDGLPLAIELAARRVGVLALPQIRAGLDDQLALLTDGSRTGPARHRELRTAIEWSHRLLSPAEQTVFRRLSILSGGFDIQTATAVCAADESRSDDVPRLVDALIRKSLVVGGTEVARFRQLHPVRVYGRDRLAASGELDTIRDRAADWLAGIVEPMTRTVYLYDVTLQRLRQERDNIAEAVRFTAAQADDRHVLLAVALARVGQEQDPATGNRQLLTSVLEQVPKSEYRSDALAAMAEIACRQGDLVAALRSAGAAVQIERGRIERGHHRPVGLAKALHVLAFTHLCRGAEAPAIAAERECLDIVRRLGHDVDTALVMSNLAWQLLQSGQDDEAERLLIDRVPVCRDLPALPRAYAAAMHTVGVLRLARGQLDAAEESFAEGLHRAPAESLDGAPLVEGLAITAVRRGDAERALCLAAAASAVRRRLGVVASAEWRYQVEQAMAAARCRLDGPRAAAATAAGDRIRGNLLRSYALRYVTASPDALARQLPSERLLTERELHIAELVAEGLTNRQIADRLRLSVGTVRATVTGLLGKLYLRSRIQLAVWAATRTEHQVS